MHKISHHDQNPEYKLLNIAIVIVIIILFTIVSTSLFRAFISSYMVYVNALIIILTVIALAITAYSLSFSGTSFKLIDSSVKELESAVVSELIDTELLAEFVKETSEGKTYQRLIDLVRNAKKGLTVVSTLESHTISKKKYSNNEFEKVKFEYYEALKRQIFRHQGKPFYREVIVVPKSYEDFPFYLGQEHFLRYIAGLQEANSAKIYASYKSSATSFIIIDKRYVVLPILYEIKSEQQIRQGILILEDKRGVFVDNLETLFDKLKAQSKPLHFGEDYI